MHVVMGVRRIGTFWVCAGIIIMFSALMCVSMARISAFRVRTVPANVLSPVLVIVAMTRISAFRVSTVSTSIVAVAVVVAL